MNKLLIIITTLFLCNSCKKQTNETSCFKVKRLHSICNDIIFEIKDPAFYYLGERNWRDATSGNTYNSVFEQKNNCQTIVVDANNEATVEIADDSNVADCFFCLALYPGTLPAKKLSIKNCP
jgi:hypothetical protein